MRGGNGTHPVDGTTTTYDAIGNLLSVEKPNGGGGGGGGRTTVDYIVDSAGRRIGRKVDGVLVQRWIYSDALRPVAELDAARALKSACVYATQTRRVGSDSRA